MSNLSNRAAWLNAKGQPLSVSDAPIPTLKPNQILVRIHATAINPADVAVQKLGVLVTHYPAIIGCDFAGVVAVVGEAANSVYNGQGQAFAGGDRILGTCLKTDEDGHGSFQTYTTADPRVCAKLPDSVDFQDACVMPLAFATAAAALYEQESLGLELPSLPLSTAKGTAAETTTTPSSKAILIWGGSSSVGSCAIQMCKAAGLVVATTAGKANLDYCKELGADFTFDHRSQSVIDDIVSAFQDKDSVGVFDAIIAPETLVTCGMVASRLGGRKFVATVLPPGWAMPEEKPKDVTYGFTDCSSIIENEIGKHLFGGWVTSALEDGTLKCRPQKETVGRGLEAVQVALDAYGNGVSAKKVVVDYE